MVMSGSYIRLVGNRYSDLGSFFCRVSTGHPTVWVVDVGGDPLY